MTITYGLELKDSFITKSKAERMLKEKGQTFPSNLGTNAYYCVGLGIFIPLISDGQILAYLNGAISSFVGWIDVGGAIIDSEAIKLFSDKKRFKFLPQTIKALKSVPTGSRISTNVNSSAYSRTRTNGMKLRSSEVLKALLLGYINVPADNDLISMLTNNISELASRVDKKLSLTAKTVLVDKYLNDKLYISPTDKVRTSTGSSLAHHSCGSNVSEWQLKHLSIAIGHLLIRSSKTFDNKHEVKWRKPPKSSLWPWTLDHHWFEIQESPITAANHSYKALLSGDSKRSKMDSVDAKYPIFHRQNSMDYGRRVLEGFFNSALKDKSSRAWGILTHTLISNMDWVVANPYYAIPKLCLTLGVVPKFNESGVFERFVKIQGNTMQPTKKVYIESDAIDVDHTHKLEPMLNLTMALCYTLGLVSLSTLEKSIGLVNAGEGLGNSKEYVHVNMGDYLVCCIPKSYSYDVGKININRIETKLSQMGDKEDDQYNEEYGHYRS